MRMDDPKRKSTVSFRSMEAEFMTMYRPSLDPKKAECRSALRWGIACCFLVVLFPSWSNAANLLKVTVRFALPSGELQPLPGATVTVQPPAGKALQSFTDDAGSVEFADVTSGECMIQAEMEGFRTIRKKVVVAATAPTAVEIELPLEQLSTSVDVVAESEQEKLKAPQLPEELQEALLKVAPLVNEKFQDALPLLPGVVRGPDGLLNLKGARASQSGLLVNSVNVTDPVTGQYAMELPIEAIESVKVYANPYSAEFGKFTGAVTSIETRPGTDKFKFLFTNFMPRLRFVDGSIRGFESFTPRLALAGPVVPGKLYFTQHFEYRFILTPVESLPEPDNVTQLETFDSFTRLDWNVSDDNHVTGVFSLYPQNLKWVTLDTFHPQPVTPNYKQRGFFLALGDKAVLNLNSLLESTFSVKDLDANVWGQGLEDTVITPDGWQGNFYNTQDRTSRRYEWVQTLTLNQKRWHGLHNPKFGYVVSHSDFDGTDLSRDALIRREDGTLYQRFEFTGPGTLSAAVTEVTAFVQDRWQVGAPLTLDLGVRLDWDTISRRAHPAPRLGFAWLPFADDPRTVLRGGLGLFYDKIPLNAVAFPLYQRFKVTNYAADGQTVSAGPVTFLNVLGGGRLDNPYALTWNVELDRELYKGVLLRLGYENREQRDDLVVDPVLGDQPELVVSSRGSSSYRELQATVVWRFRQADELTFSYVRSRAMGNLNAFEYYFGNYHYPVIRFDETGPQPYDVPNRFLFTGVVNLPWGLILAPVLEVRDGFPYSRVDEQQQFVSARNRGGRFPHFASLDFTFMKKVDIKFRKDVYHCQIGVKVYNTTNHWNPRDVQNNVDSPEFGTFYNSVGRVFRGKFEIEF